MENKKAMNILLGILVVLSSLKYIDTIFVRFQEIYAFHYIVAIFIFSFGLFLFVRAFRMGRWKEKQKDIVQ
jgi:hypothetical protein